MKAAGHVAVITGQHTWGHDHRLYPDRRDPAFRQQVRMSSAGAEAPHPANTHTHML